MGNRSKKTIKDSIIGIFLFFGIICCFLWFKFVHEETQSFKNSVLLTDKFRFDSFANADSHFLLWDSDSSFFVLDIFGITRIEIQKGGRFAGSGYTKPFMYSEHRPLSLFMSPDKKWILLDCSDSIEFIPSDHLNAVKTSSDYLAPGVLNGSIPCNRGIKWWASDSSGLYVLIYYNPEYKYECPVKEVSKFPANKFTPLIYFYPINGNPHLVYKGEPIVQNRWCKLLGVTKQGEPVVSYGHSLIGSGLDPDQSTIIIKYDNTGTKVLEKHKIEYSINPQFYPYNIQIQRLSPKGNMIAEIKDKYVSPSLFERLLNRKQITKRRYELYVTDLNGHIIKNLGGMNHTNNIINSQVGNDSILNIEWLPDGKHISVLCGTKLYLVPV